MPEENTQYGLNNYLSATKLTELSDAHFQIQLLNNKTQASLYLNIYFLKDDLIRFHYRFDKDFSLEQPNQHLNFDLGNIKNPTAKEEKEYFQIQSNSLKVLIHKKNLKVEIQNSDGDLISSDFINLGFWSKELNNPKQSYQTEISCYRAYQDLENPPCIYGLGDKTGVINRWGRRFRNSPIDALGYDSEFTDPLYKDIPFFIHFERSTQHAHGIFFDNFNKKTFDFGKERKPGQYYYFSAEAGELNYYFFNGPSIKKVLQDYLALSGMPALMPDYALGYLASGMSYLENYGDQDQQDQRVEKTLKRFSENKVTASAFHMSSGYILNSENKRQQFIWNQEKFPEPKKFSEQIEKLGAKLCANVKPVLLLDHPYYKEAEAKDVFIKDKNGKTLVVDYWGGQGSYIDFRKDSAQTWWQEKLKENILDQGIAGVWNDNNEYEIFEEHEAQGHEMEMSLLMSKLSYDLAKELNPKEEPWILSRSGYSGIQKYAQTWIGDNYSSWKSLQYDNAILSSMSISGLVHSGTDIGGFYGPEVDPELFLRWIQCGVFSPRFSIHSYKKEATEPDMFKTSHPEFFKIIQNFFKLREDLLPYIKEQNQKAHQEGIPIMRPLVYDFQDDENIWDESFNYMFGDQYLIAPIYKTMEEEEEKEIYLPGKGFEWTHHFNGEKYLAGQSHKLKNSFEYIHCFSK